MASEYRFANLNVGWTVEKFVAEEKKETKKPAKKVKPVAKKPVAKKSAAKAKPKKKK